MVGVIGVPQADVAVTIHHFLCRQDTIGEHQLVNGGMKCGVTLRRRCSGPETGIAKLTTGTDTITFSKPRHRILVATTLKP